MSEYTDKKNKKYSSNIANENFYGYQFNENLFSDEEKDNLKQKSLLKHLLIFGSNEEIKEFCKQYDINKVDNVLSLIFQSGNTDVLKYITKPMVDFNFSNTIDGTYYTDTINGENLKLNERNWIIHNLLFNKDRYKLNLGMNYDKKNDKKIDKIENDFYKKLESQNINLNTRIEYNFLKYPYKTKVLDLILLSNLNIGEKFFNNNYLIQKQLDIVNWDMQSRCETLATLITIGGYYENTKNPFLKKIIDNIDVSTIDFGYDFNKDVQVTFKNLESIIDFVNNNLGSFDFDFLQQKLNVKKHTLFDIIISHKSGIKSKALNNSLDKYLSSLNDEEQKEVVSKLNNDLDLDYNQKNSFDSFYVRKILNHFNDENNAVILNKIACCDIENLNHLTEYNNIKISKKHLKKILEISDYNKVKEVIKFYNEDITDELKKFYKNIDKENYKEKSKIFLELLNDINEKSPTKKRKI